jgi:acyl-CoA reductase-like NAD-dependent aldehyde dehydrogenase
MTRIITNPATLAPLGEVAESALDDVERAAAAAGDAARPWSETPGTERAALLGEIAGAIRRNARALVELSIRESGVPRCESLDEVQAAAAIFDFFARTARDAVADADAADAGATAAAVLIPFELPLPVMAAAVARCLAAGRSMVCKPPVQNPLGCLEMARAFEVLPAATVQLVTGGAGVGRALISHPRVREVLFTGTRAAALEVAAAAGGKHLDLEPGGLDAHIVCGDADLELAVPCIAWARLRNGGQGCMSGGHVYVERSIAAEFVDRMHPCMGFLDVDDPAKDSTDLGPLISLDAAKRIEDQVGRTLRAGARLILGGRRFRPSGLAGHFFQPTLLTDVEPGGVPMREELLGPVITVSPVSGLAEALQLWEKFGSHPPPTASSVSIHTGDSAAAVRAVEAMSTGIFRINDPAVGDLGPFSGLRHRGIRRALGGRDRDSGKWVEVVRAIERKPWWFPYIDRARSI